MTLNHWMAHWIQIGFILINLVSLEPKMHKQYSVLILKVMITNIFKFKILLDNIPH